MPFFAGIWFFFICQSCRIIHADTGEHLHFFRVDGADSFDRSYSEDFAGRQMDKQRKAAADHIAFAGRRKIE